MLIEFSVENYLSFRERRVLSMEASGISDFPENTFETEGGRHKLLTGALIYGANSSGKSNLIKAFEKMADMVYRGRRRFRLGIVSHHLFQPSLDKPSRFEVIISVNKFRYRYGFEATNEKITAEWLFLSEKVAERMLFLRQAQTIEISDDFPEGKGLEEKTSDQRLFINVIYDFNGKIAANILEWFRNSYVISGLSHRHYSNSTIGKIRDEKFRKQIISFYKDLDLGFTDLILKPVVNEWTDEETGEVTSDTSYIPKTFHIRYDENLNPLDNVMFDLSNQESDGTNKLFNLTGSLFNSLDNGLLLIIDELDSSLHPLIMLKITSLFNSTKTNPKNAQLIFTTHDTNLLHYGKYRRDQIWFTEKDKYGGTDLYSLAEIKDKPRKEADFQEQYIKGRYGAIPYIGNIEKLFEEWHSRVK